MNSTTAGSASNKCLDAEVGIAVCPRAAVELAKAPFLGSPAWSGPRAPPNGWSPKHKSNEIPIKVLNEIHPFMPGPKAPPHGWSTKNPIERD